MDQYADSGQPIGDLSQYAQSIKNIESSGGNYGMVGPQTNSGDRAYGAYQVMGNNVPDWTEKHYGERLTPQQFLKNKDAQDAVFNGEFGASLKKHGNPQDAAAVWFSGRPLSQSANNSDGYITTRQYVDKFNKGLGKNGAGALAYANDDDEEDDAPTTTQAAQPALAPAPGILTKGEWKRLLKGDPQDPWSGFGSSMAQVGASLAGISNPQQAYSLSNVAKQITDNAKPTYKITVGKDGTLYRIDDQGNVMAGGGGGASTAKNFKAFHYVDPASGRLVAGSIDSTTGKPTYWSGGPQDGPAPPPAGGNPDLQGQDRYNSMTPDERRMIDAWHEGTGINPTLSRNAKQLKPLMDAAQAVYPDMDFQRYGERQNTIKGYTDKGPTKVGGQLVAGQHSAEMLEQTLDAALKLHNHSGGWAGWGQTAANKYEDAVGGPTHDNQRAQTTANYEQSATNGATEINSMINRGRGGMGEREDLKNKMFLPEAAPEVQAGALRAQADAVRKRYVELEDGLRSGIGQTWLDKHPEIQKYYETDKRVQDKLYQLEHLNDSKAPAAAAPAGGGMNWTDAQKNGWK
jgi:hypothetical protein